MEWVLPFHLRECWVCFSGFRLEDDQRYCYHNHAATAAVLTVSTMRGQGAKVKSVDKMIEATYLYKLPLLELRCYYFNQKF